VLLNIGYDGAMAETDNSFSAFCRNKVEGYRIFGGDCFWHGGWLWRPGWGEKIGLKKQKNKILRVEEKRYAERRLVRDGWEKLDKEDQKH